jgi:hypothetical protein
LSYTATTGVLPDDKIAALVNEPFDLRPKGIIQVLDLRCPINEKTAASGQFGHDEPEFTLESTDKVAQQPDAAHWTRAWWRGAATLRRRLTSHQRRHAARVPCRSQVDCADRSWPARSMVYRTVSGRW